MRIEEKDVTIKSLVEVLKNAFFDVIEHENSFYVYINRYQLYVYIDKGFKHIKMSVISFLDYNEDLYRELVFECNKMNCDFVKIRSSVSKAGEESLMLESEGYILYSDGLDVKQFVEELKSIDYIVATAYERNVRSIILKYQG
mgnify:CR=1 FL=1